jgi:hypothetical protein
MENIENAKASILDFLEGKISEKEDESFFNDDIFYFAIRTIEQYDYKWLIYQVNNQKYPKHLRGKIIVNMTSDEIGMLLENLK